MTRRWRFAMDFKAFGDKAKGMVEGAATSATTTATKMLDEFNEALPTMRALGFVVRFRRCAARPRWWAAAPRGA